MIFPLADLCLEIGENEVRSGAQRLSMSPVFRNGHDMCFYKEPSGENQGKQEVGRLFLNRTAHSSSS